MPVENTYERNDILLLIIFISNYDRSYETE